MTNENRSLRQVQGSLETFRDDQLGAMLTTCHRIMDEDESVLARETARILRLQVLSELARRGSNDAVQVVDAHSKNVCRTCSGEGCVGQADEGTLATCPDCQRPEERSIAEDDRRCIEMIGDLCFAAGLSTPDGTVLPMVKQLISERQDKQASESPTNG